MVKRGADSAGSWQDWTARSGKLGVGTSGSRFFDQLSLSFQEWQYAYTMEIVGHWKQNRMPRRRQVSFSLANYSSVCYTSLFCPVLSQSEVGGRSGWVSSDFPHLVATGTDWHLLKQTCKISQQHHCFFFIFFPLLLLHLLACTVQISVLLKATNYNNSQACK